MKITPFFLQKYYFSHPESSAFVAQFITNTPEVHASLASLIMLDDWDWQNSLKEFKLAIKLNPNYATAHHWYWNGFSLMESLGNL